MLALEMVTRGVPFRPMAAAAPPSQITEQSALGRALKRLRVKAKLTQEEAAERAGVVVQSWRRYEWGHRDLAFDKIARLAEAVNSTRDELLDERAQILAGGIDGADHAGAARRTPPERPRHLPIRDRVQAGAWLMADDLDQMSGRTYPASPDPRFPHADQWLSEVVGDSVDQLRIYEGDLVHCVDAIALGYFPKTGDIVEVERVRFQGAERQLTVKQVEVTVGGEWLLWPRSSNPRWREPLEITVGMREAEESEIRIRGLVLAVIRRLA